MRKFITGVLVRNRAGATYEGIIYDRRLTLQLPKDREIFIFDPIEPISTDLPVDEVYELVLVPFVVSVQIVSASSPEESPTDFEGWQGTVIDAHWQAQKGKYRLARPGLYEKEWILLSTTHGDLLLDPEDIKETVQEGMIVRWKKTRIDLFAVV